MTDDNGNATFAPSILMVFSIMGGSLLGGLIVWLLSAGDIPLGPLGAMIIGGVATGLVAYYVLDCRRA